MIKVGDKVKVMGQGTGFVAYILDKSPYPYHIVKNKELIGIPPYNMDYQQYEIYKLDDLELFIDKEDKTMENDIIKKIKSGNYYLEVKDFEQYRKTIAALTKLDSSLSWLNGKQLHEVDMFEFASAITEVLRAKPMFNKIFYESNDYGEGLVMASDSMGKTKLHLLGEVEADHSPAPASNDAKASDHIEKKTADEMLLENNYERCETSFSDWYKYVHNKNGSLLWFKDDIKSVHSTYELDLNYSLIEAIYTKAKELGWDKTGTIDSFTYICERCGYKVGSHGLDDIVEVCANCGLKTIQLNPELNDDSYNNKYRHFEELELHFEMQDMNIVLHDEKERTLLVHDKKNNKRLLMVYYEENNRIITEVEEYL